MTDNDNTETVCDNCGNTWEYCGKYNQRTTCPDCQRKTTIGMTEEQAAEYEAEA